MSFADARHPWSWVVPRFTVTDSRNNIAVADFEQRRFARYSCPAARRQGSELKDLVAGADARRTVDHRMRADPGAGSD